MRIVVTADPVIYTKNVCWERSLFEEGCSKILTERFEKIKNVAVEY